MFLLHLHYIIHNAFTTSLKKTALLDVIAKDNIFAHLNNSKFLHSLIIANFCNSKFLIVNFSSIASEVYVKSRPLNEAHHYLEVGLHPRILTPNSQMLLFEPEPTLFLLPPLKPSKQNSS